MNKILEAIRLYISYITDLPKIIKGKEQAVVNETPNNIDNITIEPKKRLLTFLKLRIYHTPNL